MKRVDCSLLSRLQRVLRARSDGRAKAVWPHGTKVAHHGEFKLLALANRTRCGETVSPITTLWNIMVSSVRPKAGDSDMVVVSGGRGISDGDVR